MRCYVKQMNNHTKHQISRLPADSKAFRNLAELASCNWSKNTLDIICAGW